MGSSVYVHFPYCLAKCPYCDFTSYAKERAAIDHEAYADAVIAELAARLEHGTWAANAPVTSIFFGGGTPSLWDPLALGRVLTNIQERLPTASDAEVTVECNPTSLDADRARRLLDVGVNRVSIGVQSIDDTRLRYLGRLHDAAGGVAAVRAARSVAGLRVSADLIFGLPDQSPEEAAHEAITLAGIGLEHLSCYQLTIEPGTRFFELVKKGRLPLADDGRVAESFVAVDDALGARGLSHYEISNYARPGQEARHNLGYWRGEPYLGLGCGAYGFFRTASGGVRYRNALIPEKYVQHALTGSPREESREDVDREALMRERIMLGLRLKCGFDATAASRDLEATFFTPERERVLASLAARGRIARDGGRVWIPRDAWVFADDTVARLF